MWDPAKEKNLLIEAGITDWETLSQSWLRYTGGEGLKGRNSLVWWEEECPLIKSVPVHDCNESQTYEYGCKVHLKFSDWVGGL